MFLARSRRACPGCTGVRGERAASRTKTKLIEPPLSRVTLASATCTVLVVPDSFTLYPGAHEVGRQGLELAIAFQGVITPRHRLQMLCGLGLVYASG
jgi:hypothetical protein